jgi:hypothetical protein
MPQFTSIHITDLHSAHTWHGIKDKSVIRDHGRFNCPRSPATQPVLPSGMVTNDRSNMTFAPSERNMVPASAAFGSVGRSKSKMCPRN